MRNNFFLGRDFIVRRVIFFLCVFVVIFYPTLADPIVTNGGFETGTLAGWWLSNSSTSYTTTKVVDTISASGDYSLQMEVFSNVSSQTNYAMIQNSISDYYGPTSVGCLYNIESKTGSTQQAYGYLYGDPYSYGYVEFPQNSGWHYVEYISGGIDILFCQFRAFAEYNSMGGVDSSIKIHIDDIAVVSHQEIINPGFEDRHLWGWTISENEYLWGWTVTEENIFSLSSEHAHSGNQSLKLKRDIGDSGEYGSISQIHIHSEIFEEYGYVSFWYYVPQLDDGSILTVNIVAGGGGGENGGSTASYQIFSETTGWQQGRVNISDIDNWEDNNWAGYGKIRVSHEDSGGIQSGVTAYFDDFEFGYYPCETDINIINGNFETGDLTGWSSFADGDGSIGIEDSEYVIDGDYSIGMFSGTSSYVGLYQQFDNMRCVKYLSFDLVTSTEDWDNDARLTVLMTDTRWDNFFTLYGTPLAPYGSGIMHVVIDLQRYDLQGYDVLYFNLWSDSSYGTGSVFIDNIEFLYEQPEHKYINSVWELSYPSVVGGYSFELTRANCMHNGYIYQVVPYWFSEWAVYAIQRSIDGYVWEYVTTNIGDGIAQYYPIMEPHHIGNIVSHKGNLYMVGRSEWNDYIYKSTDDGYTWSCLGEVPGETSVDHESFSLVSFGDYIYMTPPVSYGECPETYVYRSTDGVVWEKVADIFYGSSGGFTFNNKIYIYDMYGEFYSSANGEDFVLHARTSPMNEGLTGPIYVFSNETKVFFLNGIGEIFTNTNDCDYNSWVRSYTLFEHEGDYVSIGPQMYGNMRRDDDRTWHFPSAIYNGTALFVGGGVFGYTSIPDIWVSLDAVEYVPEPTPTPTPTPCVECPTQPPQEVYLRPNFVRTPKIGDCPLTVTFTDTTETNGIELVSRTWDFGDGTIVYDAPAVVEHTYTSPGKYSAQLILNDGVVSTTKAQYNAVYVEGAVFPNPTTTFGENAERLQLANFNVTEYSIVLPTAYTGLFNMEETADAWFLFWGLVFAFIFMAIFIRAGDTSLVMLFALLVAGSVMAVIPSEFQLIGQGMLVVAIATVIYILIKGRFK